MPVPYLPEEVFKQVMLERKMAFYQIKNRQLMACIIEDEGIEDAAVEYWCEYAMVKEDIEEWICFPPEVYTPDEVEECDYTPDEVEEFNYNPIYNPLYPDYLVSIGLRRIPNTD